MWSEVNVIADALSRIGERVVLPELPVKETVLEAKGLRSGLVIVVGCGESLGVSSAGRPHVAMRLLTRATLTTATS